MTSDHLGQLRNVVDITSARARPAVGVQVPPAEIRAQWRRATGRAGWSFPGDWWVPPVDAVTEAVAAGHDFLPACRRLGQSRAAAGVDMHEALSDIEALWTVAAQYVEGAGGQLDLAAMVHSIAVGWAEHADRALTGTPCEDPLTALTTTEYLATRLGEIYRESESRGRSAARSHALVVASLMDPGTGDGLPPMDGDPVATWDSALQMVLVSEAMHRVFSAGETIAEARPHTAVALVVRQPALPARVASLRELIERDRLSKAGWRMASVGVWVEGLPSSLRHAVQLLRELGR